MRTIGAVLGLPPLGVTDGMARPMSDLFQLLPRANDWRYSARASEVLRATGIPLPPPAAPLAAATAARRAAPRPTHDAAWWARAMADQDFSREDALDDVRFNRTLWRGLMGDRPFPAVR